MAKYLLQGADINWLAILALLTFVFVFVVALALVFARSKESYRDVARSPLTDSYPAPEPQNDPL
jgi:hypothetical protein